MSLLRRPSRAIGIIYLVISPDAFSQQINGLADIQLQREQQREQAQRREDEATPDVRLQAPVSHRPSGYPEGESPCFVIREVKLEGDQAERFRWTLGSVSSALGRCLGSVGINTLVGQIQNALIEQGYVTSRVLAPPQDLLAPADVIGKYPVVGRPDGLFVSTPDYIGNLLKKTGGNNDLIKYELGIEPQYWNGPLIRIDISNPLQQTARLPSGLEGGANSLFIRGGFMPSGAPEIVIDPVPTSSVTKIPVKKRWK